MQLLHDADPLVVAWSAFGLGSSCTGRESEVTRELVTRAASSSLLEPELKAPEVEPASVEPELALSLALSRCASGKVERTLVAWLAAKGARATGAALGLARLAERQGHLEDGSLVGLLDAANREDDPLATALLAVGRLQGLDASVAARLTQVAESTLAKPGPDRSASILALAQGDHRATALLSELVLSSGGSIEERTLAAHTLAERGEEGQAALRELLGRLAPGGSDAADASWPVVLSILRALSPPVPAMSTVLDRIATLPVAGSLDEGEKHRLFQARCLAAALLAVDKSDGPRLLGCDQEEQSISGKLALLEVLDRGKLAGRRLGQWQSLLSSNVPRLRSAALKMMANHSEIRGMPALLSHALDDTQAGTVATAAQVLAQHPDLAAKAETDDRSGAPEAEVVTALTRALDRKYPPDQIAVRAQLLDAVAALKLLSSKSQVEQCCHDANPTLRQHAKRALEALGDTISACEAKTPEDVSANVQPGAPPAPVTLVFETTAGEHRVFLRPDLAPENVGRVLQLVRSGFYDNMRIHRAVPGSVVQFGDPLGDGYGGAGLEPVSSEPSPIHFGAFSVGMADVGRDTASSQIFITLVPAPLLDGEYTYIGTASSSWEAVVLDDVIERVRVE